MDEDAITPVGGTAVVVVPGVGDDGPGDTVGSMTGALLREMGPGARAIPYTRTIVVPRRSGSRDGPAVHDVRCALLMRPGRPEPLMVYEMHWADLSRFPNRVLRFVLTLYGMLFQVATIGLEAYRALDTGAWQRRAVRVFSYVTTVWIVGLTAGAAVLGVEFAAMVSVDGATRQTLVAIVVTLVVAGLALIGDSFLRGNGWRFSKSRLLGRGPALGRPGWAFGAIALAIAVAPLLVHWISDPERPLPLAVHDVLWQWVRWVLPIAWCAVAAIAVLLSVMLLWRAIQGSLGDPGSRAHRTAVLSVVVGGLGIAVLGALLVAGALAVTTRLTGNTQPVPLEAAQSVGTGDDPTFGPYSTEVFAYTLRPLGMALTCALALIVLLVAFAFAYASALAQAKSTTAPRGHGPSLVLMAVILVGVGAAALVVGDSAGAHVLSVAFVSAGIGLLAGGWWANRFGPKGRPQPIRRGFDRLLRYLGGRVHALAMALALVVASAALVMDTPWTSAVGERLGDYTNWIFSPFTGLGPDNGDFANYAQISTTVIVLVAVGALLRTRLAAIARGLDVAYDVATYLRVTHGRPSESDRVEPPRRRVLRRYAALLLHIDRVQRPERILIVAHSQGSMYSLALLFRDVSRDAADTRDDSSWTVAPSPSPSAPVPRGIAADPFPRLRARVSLMTAGCPVLQTYSPNFPGQYEWPGVPATAQARLRAGGVEAWRNVYRSGDYFGRALWSGTCAPEFASGPLSERCIGPGQHTGYWSDPRFAREVLALL